jgi:hypothetical protein
MAETSETPFVRCRFVGVPEIRDPDGKRVYYPNPTTLIFDLPDHVYLHFKKQQALARLTKR